MTVNLCSYIPIAVYFVFGDQICSICFCTVAVDDPSQYLLTKEK